MKKYFSVILTIILGLTCGIVFARIFEMQSKIITCANISVAYPLSTIEREQASEIKITSGINNSGTIYIGNASVNSTDYMTYQNAGDADWFSFGDDVKYRMDKLYVRSSVANDTVAIYYSNN